MIFCNRILQTRSQYGDIAQHRCHLPVGHLGRCDEFPFLRHLLSVDRQVADKIKRDATMTTGAAWKSTNAGPNRILRWVMLLSDEELLDYGINMANLKPGVVAKLREKAAEYDACIMVAAKLTWLVYQMPSAPQPPDETKEYLEDLFGEMNLGTTCCDICRLPLDYSMFSMATRGRAVIETCHKNPRMHNADNIGFGHRDCNIAQGAKTLDEFYAWIQEILMRVK